MRIAHLLPTSAVFPLKKHNGRYEWALRLARAQVARGHEVTIFAGEGSEDTSSIVWRSVKTDETDKKRRNLVLLNDAFQNTSFDIYHSHFDTLHYLAADRTEKPVIVTQHWFPQESFAEAVSYNTRHNVIAVPVTQLMQTEDIRIGIPATHHIYHGVDLSLFKYGDEPSNHLLFVGRIHPNKGVDEAIRYAIKTRVPLDIIGKINETERTFWEELQPFIDGDLIRYIGQKPPEEVAKAYRQAKAFIFPSKQPEAFGQVTIEAQACGTPVIISDRGASRELVEHNKTGFVCNNDAEFINAIHMVDSIRRSDCRAFAERFDKNDMVTAYDELYRRAIESIASTLI